MTVVLETLVTDCAGGNSKLGVPDIKRVWDHVFAFVDLQMSSGRGVMIKQFGTFAFAHKHIEHGNKGVEVIKVPVFTLSEAFSTSYNVTCKKPPAADGVTVVQLNVSAIASGCGLAREQVQSAVRDLFASLGEHLATGEGAAVDMKIARLACSGRTIIVKFNDWFSSKITQVPSTSNGCALAGTAMGTMTASRPRNCESTMLKSLDGLDLRRSLSGSSPRKPSYSASASASATSSRVARSTSQSPGSAGAKASPQIDLKCCYCHAAVPSSTAAQHKSLAASLPRPPAPPPGTIHTVSMAATKGHGKQPPMRKNLTVGANLTGRKTLSDTVSSYSGILCPACLAYLEHLEATFERDKLHELAKIHEHDERLAFAEETNRLMREEKAAAKLKRRAAQQVNEFNRQLILEKSQRVEPDFVVLTSLTSGFY
eukprot:TRINITY_DN4488_c0_g1_i1.p1 TRINITY_DN4488_c0_g1~~TRINITY_DN4488_c0_g1_i1.p1  ORF type:complete len:439 (-),score=85.35 TRINITY_DN4488_c0_g1_i1:730-2010(-)